MARPKDPTISQAFLQKSDAAADKLRRFQAQQLAMDMNRLFDEGLHSDMTVELQHSVLNLHSCIIKARSHELYNRLFALPGSCIENKSVSMKDKTYGQKIEKLLRILYTENDISKCLQDFDNILTDENNSLCNGDINKQDLSDSNDCEIYNRICREEESNSINESHEQNVNNKGQGYLRNEFSDEHLYEMAEEIVNNAVKNALEVSSCTEQHLNGEKTATVCNGESDFKEVEKVKTRNTVKNSNNFNGTDVISETNEETHSSCKNICDNLRKKIKSTSEESCDSINKLLQVKCRLQTVVTSSGQLTDDLLRLWLMETDCDAQILINSKVFPVHKCILSCRSMYFSAMLGGSWRESEQEQIILEGIDKVTMQQTLQYLYGGVVEVDPTCSLGGLVMMSDMYTMEGLKDVVAFNLNKDYCHFFHRPCSTCIVGVPDALTLTMIYNMEAMREKCVKWINKNFGKVWPTKQFAQLPQEVLDFCVTSAIKDLAMDNVIDIMVECRQLNEKIPRLKWSECILDMTTRLMDGAIEFASQKFVNIVGSKTFRNIDKQGIAFNQQPLEDIFGMVIMALSPENSCQAYLSLEKWCSMFKAREEETVPLYSEEFTQFVQFLFKKCREHLCLYIHQAAHTVEWTYLSKESQKEIMEEANYVCIDSPNKGRMARPQLTSMLKKVSSNSGMTLKEYFDQHFGLRVADKKSKSPSPSCVTQDRKNKTIQKSNTKANTTYPSNGTDRGKSLVKTRKTKTEMGDSKRSEELSKGDNPSMTKKTERSSVVNTKQRETTLVAGSSTKRVKSENKSTLQSKSTDSLDKVKSDVDNELGDDPDDKLPTSQSTEDTLRALQQALSIERPTFIPHFGQRPLHHVQNSDRQRFLIDREGPRMVVERQIVVFDIDFKMSDEIEASS